MGSRASHSGALRTGRWLVSFVHASLTVYAFAEFLGQLGQNASRPWRCWSSCRSLIPVRPLAYLFEPALQGSQARPSTHETVSREDCNHCDGGESANLSGHYLTWSVNSPTTGFKLTFPVKCASRTLFDRQCQIMPFQPASICQGLSNGPPTSYHLTGPVKWTLDLVQFDRACQMDITTNRLPFDRGCQMGLSRPAPI